MLEKIKNWWNADKIKLRELEDRLNAHTESLRQAQAEQDRLTQEIAKREDTIAELDVDHSTSLEPWVEIKSESIDPIKGLVIELDWNDAFVQYLKDNGIEGRDDDTIVQKWIAMLYKDMMSGLETQAIEKSDIKRVNDFE